MDTTFSIYLRLFRVNNYVKNIFIFAPLFFVFQFDKTTVLSALYSFVLFSFLASSVYILNDIFDVKSDQKHPQKKYRPIAANHISIKKALWIAVILLLISIGGVLLLNHNVCYAFLSYLGINILYNLVFKKIPIIDVVVISLGFVIRIFIGSYSTNIPASQWILFMTFLLSLFLGFSKRRADVLLMLKTSDLKSNLKQYSKKGINLIVLVLGALICGSYLGYTLSAQVVERIGSTYVFITAFWVIAGIARYLKVIFTEQKYYSPTSVVIKDLFLQLIMLGWLVTFIIIFYL